MVRMVRMNNTHMHIKRFSLAWFRINRRDRIRIPYSVCIKSVFSLHPSGHSSLFVAIRYSLFNVRYGLRTQQTTKTFNTLYGFFGIWFFDYPLEYFLFLNIQPEINEAATHTFDVFRFAEGRLRRISKETKLIVRMCAFLLIWFFSGRLSSPFDAFG